MPTKSRSKTRNRTIVQPHKSDRSFVRRNTRGQIKKKVKVGRSIAADRRSKAKTTVKKGQGDRGDISIW